ncbi:hypothetical protein KKF84_11450 [Myxococcota bacterium]|nr:hypothetical protein [Myxococcota bacterium]MBU1535927.1 hypothetical protein [Myxococcota bacterium]
MIITARYYITQLGTRKIFQRFLAKLPAQNVTDEGFEVDLTKAGLKIGEALHVLNAMIDRHADTIVVEYSLLNKPFVSILGYRDNVSRT